MEDGVDKKSWRRNDGGGLMKEETWSGYEVMERNDGGGMMEWMRNRGAAITILITCQTTAMNNTTFGRNQKSTTWSTIRLMLKYSLYDDSRETKYIQLPKA